jgi:hypothetical protein
MIEPATCHYRRESLQGIFLSLRGSMPIAEVASRRGHTLPGNIPLTE